MTTEDTGRSSATGESLKRDRSESTSTADLSAMGARELIVTPLLPPHFHEPMTQYFPRLKAFVSHECKGIFSVTSCMTEDGLYLHKRPVRVLGEAMGQAAVLEQAGTVFHHVTLYVRAEGKVIAVDYGPEGDIDMTTNWTEAVPCGNVLQEEPDVTLGEGSLPFLHIQLPYHALDHPTVKQAVQYMELRKYHAILNNCMQNCDFLLRIMTGGLLRDAPLIYDVLCGKVPHQDSPLLLMFLLMSKMSWFNVCDGGPHSSGFLVDHDCPPPLEGMPAAFSQPQAPTGAAGPPSSKHARVAPAANAGTQEPSPSSAPPQKELKSGLLPTPAKEPRAASLAESVLTESVH